jgi:hypothetical protein
MQRHSNLNRYVVFPSKRLEQDWLAASDSSPPREKLARKFEALLESAHAEQEIHEFFELHPQLLPGVEHYHNGPRGDIVVTKLPLGQDFVTDFAFASENSQSVQFTCVEIEGPRVSIFGRGAQFSREYLEAKQQIADWNLWAQQNIREAIRLFDRLGRHLPQEYYAISLQCFLVVGRRGELNTLKRKQRWAAENALRQASMAIMTYDRLIERMKSECYAWRHKMLVCSYKDRALHAKRISA